MKSAHILQVPSAKIDTVKLVALEASAETVLLCGLDQWRWILVLSLFPVWRRIPGCSLFHHSMLQGSNHRGQAGRLSRLVR